MALVKLTSDDKERIARAVKQAESKTSGEIATAFIRESYDYALYELIFAILCGFFYLLIMLFFVNPVEQFMQNLFWEYSSAYLVAAYGFSVFVVMIICYFLANITALDRMIIPRKVQIKKVRERAVRYFVESGVSYTKDRTGILIFISLLERRVELLADSGINNKIETETWEHLVNSIIEGIKTGKMVERLIEAIEACGNLLAEHFPRQTDDINELKDEIDVL